MPHLGNIIGCVLSADVFARYCRSKGHDAIYICGTDDYGTATEIKALEEGVTPKQLCDKYYKIHKEIYEWFGISTDIFGRTSTPLHTKITHEIFLDLHKNGCITEDETIQAYDEEKKMFLADRFIEGTCPHCNYGQARADQCEKCGKLLNFDELISPRSKISGTVPTKKKTRHLFIDLPKMQAKLEKWIDKTSKKGSWSENSYRIAKAWCKEGLKKRCITRDLKWGVQVPLKGWENKIFYVWFDAPIGYLSITANLTEKWEEWWQKPDEVNLYQFMGKDNVPFHTVIFPATLIGTGKGWTLLHHISTTEFLNFEGGKFSKSKGIGVFGTDAMQSGISADVWRYYLLTNRPEKTDSDFTWKDFAEKLNNELLANIGNLVNRTLVFAQREFDGKVPDGKLSKKDKEFVEGQNRKFEKIGAFLEKVHLKDALHAAMEAGKEANAYFQKSEPWKTAKQDRERCSSSIYVLLHQVKDLAIVLEPFIPNSSALIFKQLNAKQEKWSEIGKFSLKPGHKLGKPQILFKKLEKKEIDRLSSKYSGKKQEKEGESFLESLDLEVGKITSVEKHPHAKKLYVEKVQMGRGEERQIVSGLVPYCKPEELLGKNIIIVKNLKPAVLRFRESKGMLLAAEKQGKLEVLCCPDAAPGDKVEIDGVQSKPAEEITIGQFSKISMQIKDFVAYADGKKLLVNGKPVKTSKIKDGKIT